MKKLNSVLMVDADPISLYINNTAINELGLTEVFLFAGDGEEAFMILDDYFIRENEYPNLIFLDLKMQAMNGLEFIEKVKSTDRYTLLINRIVVVSSSFATADIEKARDMGVKWYVTKPLTKDSLLSLLASTGRGEFYFARSHS
jgi:CheY-like chemotaxis protein